MPQIEPGQVVPGQNGAPNLYGVENIDNTTLFRERLLKLWQAQDWVLIKNIADEPIYWQYLPEHAEEITHDPGTQMKNVRRGKPEMWMMEPGAEEPIPGVSAYHCMDVMYKNVVANKTLKQAGIDANYDKANQHIPKNFNYSDGGAQENFIKQAFKGIVNPTFAGQPTPELNEIAEPTKELQTASKK